jgi:hypothetical protein
MFRLIKISLLILSVLCPDALISQEVKVVKDFRFNGSAGVSKEFFDVLELGFESTIKLEKNASLIDEIDFDIDLKYSPYKFLTFGIGYRFAENRKNDGQYVIKQRLSSDLELGAKLKRFKFGYRIRYQNIDDDFFLYDEDTPPQHILRNKLEVGYNIRNCRFSPYVYSELYGILDSPDLFALKIKYALGGKYFLGKYGKVKVFYRIIKELNNSEPYTYYNLGVGYYYDF